MSPQGQQAQPQQRMQSSQMMPPPPRPNKEEREDRGTKVDDINDPMFGSGINLADEENYMHSFQTNQSTSFGSSTATPNHSFNQLTQSFDFDSQRQPGGAFGGTMGEPQSQEEIENQMKKKRQDAARARAEREQHPMANQFLLTGALRTRMDRVCNANGVQMDVRGLYQRLPPPPSQPQYRTNVMMNEKEGIASTEVDNRPEYTAGRGEPWEQIASLIQLATGERMRGLLDDAFALARARRFGDHGRVPPDFADIAIGRGERREEEVRPESVTGKQWDKVPDAAGSPAANGDHLPNGAAEKSSTPQPRPTISFSDSITNHLREVAKRDQAAEEERLRKREARRKRAAENAQSTEEAAAAETPAPEEAAAPAVKISKKEQERQKKEANKHAEANLHQTTNQTAAMMALGGKNKLKKYSWMTGGAASMPTNRFAPSKPASTNTSSPGASSPAPNAVKQEGGSPVASGGAAGGAAMSRGGSQQQEVKVPEWGDWREDGADGRGIQARDWILVLERDGREKKTLQRAYNRLS